MPKGRSLDSWKLLYWNAFLDCKTYPQLFLINGLFGFLVVISIFILSLILLGPAFSHAREASVSGVPYEQVLHESYRAFFHDSDWLIMGVSLSFPWFFLLVSAWAFMEGAVYKIFLEGIRKKKSFSLSTAIKWGRFYFLRYLGFEFFVLGIAALIFLIFGGTVFFSKTAIQGISGEILFLILILIFIVTFFLFMVWVAMAKAGIANDLGFKKSLKMAWRKLKAKKSWAFKGLLIAFGLWMVIELGVRTVFWLLKFVPAFGGIFIFLGLLTRFMLMVFFYIYLPALNVRFWNAKYIQGKTA